MSTVLESTDWALDTNPVQVGPYKVQAYLRTHGGAGQGGDRFALYLAKSNDMFFYLADAPGHGRVGEMFWHTHGKALRGHWETFVRSSPSSIQLRQFAMSLNNYFYGWSAEHAGSQAALCLLFGVASPGRRLRFANCGYGNHALITTQQGAWWPRETDLLSGLKLGWVPNTTWDTIENSFVQHQVDGMQKCALITDGFLGDDHADPQQTLRTVEHLANRCAHLAAPDLIPKLCEIPHDRDDATILLIS